MDTVSINVGQQIAYWRDSAIEDIAVASELLARRRIRHGMFFLHLSLEYLRQGTEVMECLVRALSR
jgi:hypothetical protein